MLFQAKFMFADDTKMYRGITTSEADCQQLQSDIDNLVSWSTSWHLLFNTAKCKVMSLGHSSIVNGLVAQW